MKELKYRIADWLFEAELDEAFELGIKEGGRRQKEKTIFALELALEETPKSHQKGFMSAMKVVEDAI